MERPLYPTLLLFYVRHVDIKDTVGISCKLEESSDFVNIMWINLSGLTVFVPARVSAILLDHTLHHGANKDVVKYAKNKMQKKLPKNQDLPRDPMVFFFNSTSFNLTYQNVVSLIRWQHENRDVVVGQRCDDRFGNLGDSDGLGIGGISTSWNHVQGQPSGISDADVLWLWQFWGVARDTGIRTVLRWIQHAFCGLMDLCNFVEFQPQLLRTV